MEHQYVSKHCFRSFLLGWFKVVLRGSFGEGQMLKQEVCVLVGHGQLSGGEESVGHDSVWMGLGTGL